MPKQDTPAIRLTPLIPEKVAYWYFRLNGFLQIENFVVHPGRKGSQRTDADLLAVRFPYRAEFLLDHPEPMRDDEGTLHLSTKLIDVVIAEVKTNDPCTLNGPWTKSESQNVNRVLAAIGCVPHSLIEDAAVAIYRHGGFAHDTLHIRLIAVGRVENPELAEHFPQVVQVTWRQILGFIWHRLHNYRRQKTQVQQWDGQGLELKRLADRSASEDAFISTALSRMGLRWASTS
jgi:hypothetical protein